MPRSAHHRSHHGNVFRYSQSCLGQRADGADGRNIVESKESGEGPRFGQQFLRDVIAEFGRRDIAAELGGQIGVNFHAQPAGRRADGVPVHLCVGAEFLSLEEGDLAMAEVV